MSNSDQLESGIGKKEQQNNIKDLNENKKVNSDEENLIKEDEEISRIDKKILRDYVRIGVTVFVTFVCCILFFFIIFRFKGLADVSRKLINTAQPIIIGLIIAYLLNPIMIYCEKKIFAYFSRKGMEETKNKKLSRSFGVTISILIFLGIIAFLIAILAPAVINSVKSLIGSLQGSTTNIISWIESLDIGDEKVKIFIEDMIVKGTKYVEDWFQNTVTPEAQKYITEITTGVISVVKSLVNFIIGIIVAIYVMSIQETLTGQCKKVIYAIFKPKRGNVIIEVLRKSNEIFGGFVTGKLLDSLIIGIISYICCRFMKIPDSTLVALIIGVTNIIPFFGPFVGAIPSLLIVVIQSPIHALYLLIFIIIIQQVDGNIIGPKILGNTTGLSSFWVLFAILIAGGMFGFGGMLLGVPIFGVIYYIIRRIINRLLRKKHLPSDTSKYIKMSKIDEKTNTLIYKNTDK